MIDFYGYDKCGTCRKAKKQLLAWGVEFREIDITQRPPPKKLLRALLKSDHVISDLFNKSGVQYRELNMKEKLKALPEGELLDMLAGNGRLLKRPIVTDGTRHSVGFKPEAFEKTWG